MNKLFLALSLIGVVGCSNATNMVELPQAIQEMEFGITDLSKYPDVDHNISLQFENEYNAVETYGAVAYKAIYVCNAKYDSLIHDVDGSSDYGSTIISEYNRNVASCVDETLSVYDTIPENHRQHIPRDDVNIGLELNDPELDVYNELESGSVLPMAEYSKDDPRYDDVKGLCELTNDAIEDADEKAEAVEFCVRKAM